MPPTTRTTIVRPADLELRAALRLAATFAAIKLLLHFALTLYTTHIGYGYFRDEFYYIACGHHLAWGFVDHGPIVALQARLGQILFGDSVFAIRILSATAGAIMVGLGGLVAWALGGRRPAQALAMIGLIVVPQYIGVDGFLSMNSCEPVFWTACLLCIVMLVRDSTAPGSSTVRWWILFGISAGIGLLNKPSMAFFLIALGFGLLVTSQRKILFTRWAALGFGLLIVVVLPNLIWQIHNHWPTLEFLRNGRKGGKNSILTPLQFFLAQWTNMHPLTAFLWVTGIVATLRAKSIANARWLGATYLFFYVGMNAIHAKDYYLAGIYPALFAAGAIAWEHRFAARRWVRQGRTFAFPAFELSLILTGILILPMSSPVLRPADWVRYTSAMHLHTQNSETASTGPLPQFFADRFGWNEQVALVLQAYRSLTPEEQQRVCLFAGNYGEAGAIDFLGPMQQPNLHPAMSGQNSYYTWGTHGCDPNISIAVISDTLEEISLKYADVRIVGKPTNPSAMPFENRRTVYLLRDRRPSAPFHWEDERFYY